MGVGGGMSGGWLLLSLLLGWCCQVGSGRLLAGGWWATPLAGCQHVPITQDVCNEQRTHIVYIVRCPNARVRHHISCP